MRMREKKTEIETHTERDRDTEKKEGRESGGEREGGDRHLAFFSCNIPFFLYVI